MPSYMSRLKIGTCALFMLSSCGDPPPEKSPSLASRVELAAGNVQVKQPGGDWNQAIAGLLLRHGTSIKVGAGDRALIRLDDGSGVFLRYGTEIALKRGGLELAAGELWVEAPPQEKQPARYTAGEIEISASDAGLDIKRSAGSVEVYVARGLAVVSAPGGRTELQAGERAVVKGAAPPKISPVAFWEDWTGGMADRRLAPGMGGTASGKIYALNRGRPGAPPQELEIRAQNIRVTIREGVARTTVDQRFFNPSSSQVEGYYWFTIPEGAAVDRFALDVNGVLVDGEVIERKQAHAAYEKSIQQAVDPALLEWIDGRTFRARIFPIPAAGERRVVLSYLELLPTVDGKTHYIYPMGGAGVRIQEFALEVELGEEGKAMTLASTADARIEGGGQRVTVRRSGYKPQGDFLLEMSSKKDEPLRAVRVASSRGEASYVMLRYTPDMSWEQVKEIAGHVVVVVDTSAGGDDGDRQLRADVAEAILRALSTADGFALMAADLTPRVLYPAEGLAKADEASIGKALEELSGVRPGGATDLGNVFDVALKRLHGKAQPAVVYIGDGLPTVGELDGDALARRVARSMAGSASRLFTIAVGSDANHALMARLARIGGGGTFRVDVSEQSVQEALRFVGHLKTPTITNLKLDVGAGMDQVFSSAAGKVSRGQEVTLLARTHHALPGEIKVSGELGGKPFSKSYSVTTRSGPAYSYVPTLWARQYLKSLLGGDVQKNRGTIIRLGVDYALMTPFSSFLVLESDAAYENMGIRRRPRDPIWGRSPHAALDLAAAVPLALFGCSAEKSDPIAQQEAPVSNTEVAASKSSPAMASSERPASPDPTSVRTPSPEPGTTGMDSLIDGALGSAGGRAVRPKPRARRRSARDLRQKEEKSADASKDLEEDHAHRRSELQKQTEVQLVCSDAARRPLTHRREIWSQRLSRTRTIHGWIRVYRGAVSQCELPHWRDRKALLDLVQRNITTPAQVRVLLSALGGGKARAFVLRQLLRRAVTPAMTSTMLSADTVDWSVAEAALGQFAAPAQRVAELRKICDQHPGSAGCALRLIKALIAAGMESQALPVAIKLREDGQATPALMQQIGDLLAQAERAEEAIRAYSEIVEFSPGDPAARRLLGDIYLRHGWYELAYRQYKTLCEHREDDASALLRLAAAGAGTGRVDEALRLQRKVSAGEGEPGPDDPRRWARMWSAARIARLMLTTGGKESLKQKMEQSLRRLQVLSSPGVLVLLTWEDLDQRLALELNEGRSTDRLDAGGSGLYTLTVGPQQAPTLGASVAHVGEAKRLLRYQITTVAWDGKNLTVANQAGKLVGDKQSVVIKLPGRK